MNPASASHSTQAPVWTRAAAAGLVFRPMVEADMPFMRRVEASTVEDELDPLDWSDDQKAAFVDMQFRAQHSHYRTHYAEMDWLVILFAGQPVGRLYLDRRQQADVVVDIAFLPEHRRRGWGTALIRD